MNAEDRQLDDGVDRDFVPAQRGIPDQVAAQREPGVSSVRESMDKIEGLLATVLALAESERK